jgi:hypothetical protein
VPAGAELPSVSNEVDEAASPIVVNTISSRVKFTSIPLGNGHGTLQPEARYTAGFILLWFTAGHLNGHGSRPMVMSGVSFLPSS